MVMASNYGCSTLALIKQTKLLMFRLTKTVTQLSVVIPTATSVKSFLVFEMRLSASSQTLVRRVGFINLELHQPTFVTDNGSMQAAIFLQLE